jgi:hypothetical protein
MIFAAGMATGAVVTLAIIWGVFYVIAKIATPS